MNIQHDCTHIYKLWDKEEIFTIVSRGLQPFGYIFLIFFIYDASFLRVFFCNKLAQFISSYLAYISSRNERKEKQTMIQCLSTSYYMGILFYTFPICRYFEFILVIILDFFF